MKQERLGCVSLPCSLLWKLMGFPTEGVWNYPGKWFVCVWQRQFDFFCVIWHSLCIACVCVLCFNRRDRKQLWLKAQAMRCQAAALILPHNCFKTLLIVAVWLVSVSINFLLSILVKHPSSSCCRPTEFKLSKWRKDINLSWNILITWFCCYWRYYWPKYQKFRNYSDNGSKHKEPS